LTVPLLTPSKKNLMRPSGAGGKTLLVYKKNCKAQIAAVVSILELQWSLSHPVEHPTIIWSLHMADAQDRDGVITTLLDALVKAKVLRDDAVRVNNGPWLVEKARELRQGQTPEHRITLLWPKNRTA
jgi:Holliday junction resolvase RusA-like endonuclease